MRCWSGLFLGSDGLGLSATCGQPPTFCDFLVSFVPVVDVLFLLVSFRILNTMEGF